MFPEVSNDELHKLLNTCVGNLEACIQLLLENTGSAKYKDLEEESAAENKEKEVTKKKSSFNGKTDEQLKDFVLSRYMCRCGLSIRL